MKPLAIDLFCGAGGMSEGILQAGFHIVFSSDINEDVEKTYTNRHEQLGLIQGFNTHFERADIRHLNKDTVLGAISKLELFKGAHIPQIDAIFGGPPCQGFSRAGKRRKDDPRNMLFKEYLRVINEIRPKYVVMENVEGFLDTRFDGFIGLKGKHYKDGTKVPDILQEEFNEIGYLTLKPKVLDASDYGVPQRRRRVIFIAHLDGQAVPAYPIPTTEKDHQKVTALEAIGDLIIDNELREQVNSKESKYQKDSRIGRTKTIEGKRLRHKGFIYNHDLSNHNQAIIERFSLFNEGESCTAVASRILNEGIDIISKPSLFKECVRKLHTTLDKEEIIKKFSNGQINLEMLEALLTKKNSRFRISRNSVAPTMVTLPDDFLSPFENRILTVREMARFQSFDDSFVFLGKRTTGGHRRKVEVPQYTQVGNAVPPLLAKAIALEILSAINENNESLAC